MAITRETLRLLRDMDLAVSETIDDVTRQLVEAFARGWDETVDALDQALSEIAAAGDGVTPSQIRRSQKISAAVLSIADQLDKLASQSVLVITDTLGQVMSAAVTAQAGLAGSQLPRTGPAWVFTEPDPNTLDAIIRRSAQQITAASRPLSDSATDAVRRQLVRGVSQAQHPTKVARQILKRTEGAFNGGLSRALTIARTEILDAHRHAAQAWERSNTDTLAGWQWLSNLDKRTCSSCWVQNGSFHSLEEFGPADHPNGRCSRLPVAKTWRDLGIDLDEPAALGLRDGQATFDALPEADRIAILGQGRYDAYRAGAPWQSLSAERPSAEWRLSYGVPSVAAVQAAIP